MELSQNGHLSFVNGNWVSGSMKSKSSFRYFLLYNYRKRITNSNKPDFQIIKDLGIIIFLDSNIYSGEIENGNFINCNVGPNK